MRSSIGLVITLATLVSPAASQAGAVGDASPSWLCSAAHEAGIDKGPKPRRFKASQAWIVKRTADDGGGAWLVKRSGAQAGIRCSDTAPPAAAGALPTLYCHDQSAGVLFSVDGPSRKFEAARLGRWHTGADFAALESFVAAGYCEPL